MRYARQMLGLVAGLSMIAARSPHLDGRARPTRAPTTIAADTPRVVPDTSAVTPEAIDAGRRVFRGVGGCVVCHGAQLEGGIAPTLRPHAWRDAKGGAFDEIYRVVTHGVPGTLMVAHPGGISDSTALRVAAYVWAVGHRGVKP